MVAQLSANPASTFHAAVAGWSHPLTWEGFRLLDLTDVLLMRWMGKNYKPVKRPSDVKPKKRVGKSPEAALRQLRPHLFEDE